MSTLKVANINNASAPAGGISIDTSGTVTGALPYPNRNLLYNGAMQVAQRGTSTASITTSGYYTADRWATVPVSLGTWTQSVESDGPTGSGLTKSLKLLCTTADAAPASTDRLWINYSIEGQDAQRIAKGTASAQQLTLSFWVKSNVTGTYVCELMDTDNTRNVSAAYSVSASATWEKKTITFPADTTGTLNNDNGESLRVVFWLAAGSSFTSGTLATSWVSPTDANRAVGQTNLAAATNNYWQVTGVQLEVGPVATSFEFKSYGQELRECQRYYETSFSAGVTPANGVYSNHYMHFISYQDLWTYVCPFIPFKVPKRAIPSATFYGTASNTWQRYNSDETYTNMTYTGSFVGQGGSGLTTTGMSVQVHAGGSSGLAVGTVRAFRGDWAVSAEL